MQRELSMKTYPIKILIESRCSELNISLQEMLRETGYLNISVGLKRLDQLFDADFNYKTKLP